VGVDPNLRAVGNGGAEQLDVAGARVQAERSVGKAWTEMHHDDRAQKRDKQHMRNTGPTAFQVPRCFGTDKSRMSR
jgi:hypothetical protein